MATKEQIDAALSFIIDSAEQNERMDDKEKMVIKALMPIAAGVVIDIKRIADALETITQATRATAIRYEEDSETWRNKNK